jgi:hypothetical protein
MQMSLLIKDWQVNPVGVSLQALPGPHGLPYGLEHIIGSHVNDSAVLEQI